MEAIEGASLIVMELDDPAAREMLRVICSLDDGTVFDRVPLPAVVLTLIVEEEEAGSAKEIVRVCLLLVVFA